jgi:hypothetical protein
VQRKIESSALKTSWKSGLFSGRFDFSAKERRGLHFVCERMCAEIVQELSPGTSFGGTREKRKISGGQKVES